MMNSLLIRWLCCLLLISYAGTAKSKIDVSVQRLTCEYLTNPLGIDKVKPLLGWQMSSVRKGAVQTAYRIIVAVSVDKLKQNIGDAWDSGKVPSDESQNVYYAGAGLLAGKPYYWKVQIWDNFNQVSEWSNMAFWSMGPGVQDWKGKWVSNQFAEVSSKRFFMDTWGRTEPRVKDYRSPDTAAIYLRKVFELPYKLKRATAYISGLGYYELLLNGKKIGDRVMDPVFTDYQKQVSYVTYEVTSALKSGKNALGVILGNGFYNSPNADLFQMEKANWKTPPKLLFDLQLEYTNGEKQVISSDGSWKWHSGELVYNSIRGGETIDHRFHLGNWVSPLYDDKHWQNVVVVPPPVGQLQAQYMPPMKVNEVIRPESVRELGKGIYVVDFGKNITGWMSLKVKGVKGQAIQCWYNEKLNNDGTLNKTNSTGHTGGRFQREVFILNGEGTEFFEPRFTYHGFRYVQLEGLSKAPLLEEIRAKSVHTGLDTIGSFTCSAPELNNLQHAVQRTLLNSIHGMPAEEPTREKMGWTFDAWVTMESYLYNFDAINTYKKCLQDFIDAQEPSGHIASIVPTNGWGFFRPEGKSVNADDPWWGGSIFPITEKLYEFTGDTAIVLHAFAPMKGYVDFVATTAKDGLVYWSLGDWLDMEHGKNGPGPGLTPVVQTSTAAYYWMTYKLAEFAKILGKTEVSSRYFKLAANIKDRFNAAFLDRTTGWYKVDSQTAQAMPLYLGLVPADLQQKVEDRLMDAIVNNNNHVSAGFVGVLPFLNYLSDKAMDKAYQVVTQKSSPGWLHMVKDAKSTLGENLNSKGYGTGHHPYGAHIGFWLYKYLGGIRPDPAHPGFKRFVIAPQFVEGLEWLTVDTQSLYGKIACSWKRKDGGIVLQVTVPGNTHAQLQLPAYAVGKTTVEGKGLVDSAGIEVIPGLSKGTRLLVGSGTHHFLIKK
jgi:alpha-L-rhamnosidase